MLRRTLNCAAGLLIVLAGFSAVGAGDDLKTELTNSPTGKNSAGTANATDRGSALSQPKSVSSAARNPRVLFITMQGCGACERELARLRRPGGDFDAMRARGWKIGDSAENHVQIVDEAAIPELVQKLSIHEFPTIACVANGEIVRSFKHGCTTPLDAWTFGFLLNGENERPKTSIPEQARVESTGSYPLRGNHWSIDGDWAPTKPTLISHLRGPNHASQLSAGWAIDSWSYEELRSLHDDLHEKELAAGGGSSGVVSAGYYYSQPAPNQSSQFSANRKITGR